MLRLVAATACALSLGAVVALAAPGLSTRSYIPEVVEFELDAPPAPAGVASNRGFVSPALHTPKRFNLVGFSWRSSAEPAIALRARKDGDVLDALDAGRRRWPPRRGAVHLVAGLGRRGRLGPVPDVAPGARAQAALRQHDRDRDGEGPRAERAAPRRAQRRGERRPRVGRFRLPAANPFALRMGRRAVPDASRQLQPRQGGGRPPHRHGERVLPQPCAGRDPRHLPLPPEHQRLERHRLQLRRRSLRPHLGGPRRRHRRSGDGLARPGLQRADDRHREPRRRSRPYRRRRRRSARWRA